MGIYPLFFLSTVAVGWILALCRGPIWGLMTYIFIYYNIPSHQWWGNQVPDLRWSLLAAAVTIASCFFYSRELTSKAWLHNRLGFTLLILLAWMLIQASFTPDPTRSWTKAYDFFRYVLIFFLINKIISNFKYYKFFVYSILYCTFYLSVLAHHYFHGGRLDGVGLPDAGDANMLASLVVLVLPLYIATFFTTEGFLRLFPLFGMIMVINMFIMCGSRGGFVGLLVQGIFAFLLLRKQIGLFKSLACCMLVVLSLFLLMSPQYKERLLKLGQGIDQGKDMGQISAGRTEIWKYGFLMFEDYPFGVGGGGFQALSPRYIPAHLLTHGERAPHNTYLLVLVEQSLIGLLIFSGFLYIQLTTPIKTMKYFSGNKKKSQEIRKILYHMNAVFIGLIGFWTVAFFNDRLYFECVYLVSATVPVLARLALDYKEIKQCASA